MNHPALAPLRLLGPADLERLVGLSRQQMDLGVHLDWPGDLRAWWGILGAAAAAAWHAAGLPDLGPHAADQLIAQLEAARDSAARDRRPALADVLADLLSALVDTREAGR